MYNPDNNAIHYGLLKKYRYKEAKLLEGLQDDLTIKLVRAYIRLAADVYQFIRTNEKLTQQKENFLKKLLPALSKIVTSTFYNNPVWLKENVHNINAQGLCIVQLLTQYKLFKDAEKTKAEKIKEKLDKIIVQLPPKPQPSKSQEKTKQKSYLTYLAWGVAATGAAVTLGVVSLKIAGFIAPREAEKTMRHGAAVATDFFSPVAKVVLTGLGLGTAGKIYLDSQERAESQKLLEEMSDLIKEIDPKFDLNKSLDENSTFKEELGKFLDSIPNNDESHAETMSPSR